MKRRDPKAAVIGQLRREIARSERIEKEAKRVEKLIEQARREDADAPAVRWRVLVVLNAGSPRPVSDSLLLRVLSDLDVCASRPSLRLALAYLESAGLIEIARAEAWLCKLTAAGTEVVEYRAPCAGIARPDRQSVDAAVLVDLIRQELRWRALTAINLGKRPVPDSLILPALERSKCRRELEYLESAGLIEIERAEAWLCKLTAAGTEVVEYRAPCTGIARPDRPGGDA